MPQSPEEPVPVSTPLVNYVLTFLEEVDIYMGKRNEKERTDRMGYVLFVREFRLGSRCGVGFLFEKT